MLSRLLPCLVLLPLLVGAAADPLNGQSAPDSTCLAKCWVVAVAAEARGVESFEAEVTVPPAPTEPNDSMVMFFNHGLIGGNPDSGAYSLMQGVVQWGFDGEYGGRRWLASCWHEEKGSLFNSKVVLDVGNHVPIEPGETLHLKIRRSQATVTSEKGSITVTTWDCEVRTPAGAAVLTSIGEPNPALDKAVIGLEAIGSHRTCPSFPAGPGTTFRQLRFLLPGDSIRVPQWGDPDVKPGCRFGAEVQGSSVTITY